MKKNTKNNNQAIRVFRELLTPAGERSPSGSGRRRSYRSGGKDFGVFAGAPFLYFGQRRF